MRISQKAKRTNVPLHIVLSGFFLFFPIFSSPDFPYLDKILSNPMGLKEIGTHAILLAFFYKCYYYLIPRFFFKKRYVLFLLSILSWAVLLVIATSLFYTVNTTDRNLSPRNRKIPPPHSIQDKRMPSPSPPSRKPPHNMIRAIFLDYSFYLFLVVLIFALMLSFSQRWRKVEREKLKSELDYLKAQINPHFLFNTLNSIYSLAIEKSDYTATAVVKLSGMMRYLIYEINKNYVSLEKEINYINDYIELQKFRLGNTMDIQYHYTGNIQGKLIAPLILITFVENAFKYGVNPEADAAIQIEIRITDNHLHLMVKNNKVPVAKHKTEASGLGIRNTRNRLDLLYFNKYKLNIEDNPFVFIVNLKIDLL